MYLQIDGGLVSQMIGRWKNFIIYLHSILMTESKKSFKIICVTFANS